MLEGHTGSFAVIKVPGRAAPAQVLCSEDKKINQLSKLLVMLRRWDDPRTPRVECVPYSAAQRYPVPADAANDFPVDMNISRQHDMLYMVTKTG